MQFIKKLYVILITSMLLVAPTFAKGDVRVLVGNGNITSNDIKMRSSYNLLIQGKTSTANSRAAIRNKTRSELITEKIKLQAAAKLGIAPVSGEVDRRIRDFAKQNNMSTAQLANVFKDQNSNISTLKSLITANIVWSAVVRQKFGATASVSEKQIDEAARKSNRKQTVYDLHYIILKMPSNANRTKRNKRLADAKMIRENFTKCSRVRTLTAGLGRVEVKAQPNTSLSTLSSAQRQLVRSAKIGSITRARTVRGGVEMFAVCKKSTAISAKTRASIQNKLTQSKFSKLAKEYLKELRQQANVKYK